MNFSSFPQEFQTGPMDDLNPSAMPTCPQCHSDAEVYVTNETPTAIEYTCATCGLVFYTVNAIPF